MPLGHPLLFEDLKPFGDEEVRVFEFLRKHSDASHYMVMPTEKGPNGYSTFGLYRIDPKKGFTEDDRRFFMKLGPLLRSSIRMLMLHRKWNLARISHERVFEAEKIQPLIMDLRLNIISFPPNTLQFLRELLRRPLMEGLPEFVKSWVENEILPDYRLSKLLGPWKTIARTQSGNLTCHAHIFKNEHHQPIIIITFKPHETSMNFDILFKVGITKREIEVLSYLPLGYTNQQIATTMNIEEVTVKKHLKNIARKLDSAGRTETLFQAIRKKTLLEAMAL